MAISSVTSISAGQCDICVTISSVPSTISPGQCDIYVTISSIPSVISGRAVTISSAPSIIFAWAVCFKKMNIKTNNARTNTK